MNEVGKTILLVDDEKRLRITVSDLLQSAGYRVLLAESGEEALQVMGERVPDLILLDISMPGMGGMGFLRKISEGGGRPPCPVMVLTARSNMEEFFDNLDVEGFLSKTCGPDEILRQIESVLARHERQVPAASAEPRRARILVGEDDMRFLDSLNRAFEASGHHIEVAHDGAQVLEKAISFGPDVVLVKQVLPKMNGNVLAPLLATMPKTTDVPVIIYDQEGTATAARVPSQAFEYLNGCESLDLVAAVRRALDGVAAANAKRSRSPAPPIGGGLRGGASVRP
jgi:DNA-binding response OmpR family regulator